MPQQLNKLFENVNLKPKSTDVHGRPLTFQAKPCQGEGHEPEVPSSLV